MTFVQRVVGLRVVLWLALHKGALKTKIAPTATKKERGEEALCEVCLRPSAISADVTHAVGVPDLAPATEHAEASLFAPLIGGGSCCFGTRSTPVRAIWTAESFPSTLSLSWLWRGALRSCLLMASSTGSGNESDSLAYTRRPLASIPGTSHFAFLLLTCASAEE